MKPLTYDGPRQFAVTEPARLQRDLQELANQLARVMQAVSNGGPTRWDFADTLRADGALKVMAITPVQAAVGATISLSLPRWSASLAGLPVGVERRSSTGVVEVASVAPALLNGTSSPLVLPALVRLYVFVATPLGWVSQEGA